MTNTTSSVTSRSKVLSFVRAVSVLPQLPGEQPMEARPARPILVKKGRPTPATLTEASSLAHDARNALTSLYLLSGLLGENGVLHEDHAHIAGDVQFAAAALSSLISRFEILSGNAPSLVPRTSASASFAYPKARTAPKGHVGETLTACVGLLRSVAGPRIEIHVSAESSLPPLRIEEDALSRVLMNLVKNASEAMSEGGTVRITARRALSLTSPAVLIHVSDNGPGIPAHALDRIFEPGFSSKTSRSEPCGLGLAIVRELVEAAGGKVRVASTRRRGTTFELRLPCLGKGQKWSSVLP